MRSSRAGRLAQMGALAGGQVARNTATRTANLTRSKARSEAAARARQLEMAERLVIVLGSMRGAAMKLGQVLSVVGGVVPPEAREEFQHKLAALQANAPSVSWAKMRAVVEAELGQPVGEVFAAFDRDAVAAASIGQVYRATLHDGRDVAVKVQYPGIETAVRADLKNLAVFLRMYSRLAYESVDATALASEIESRILEELDYRVEARNTSDFARIYRDHPFILVPDVIAGLSSRRVLVTDWLEGTPLPEAYGAPQAERNRLTEILFRFYYGSTGRFGLCNGDPHPGNALVAADGRVGFVDFGLVRRQSSALHAQVLAALRAAASGEAVGLKSALQELGFIVAVDRISADETMETFLHALQWYLRDEECHLAPDVAGDLLADVINPSSRMGRLTRHQSIPPETTFWLRGEIQGLGTLGQLRPQLNLHRVAREWIFDEPPVTDLGRQHAAWESGAAMPGRDW